MDRIMKEGVCAEIVGKHGMGMTSYMFKVVEWNGIK